ncbi:MAG: hypothetical protein ACK41W_01155 [Cyanobacteriota bacterium]
MSTPQSLVQATINRIGARLGGQLADRAAELAVLAQDAPQRLQREWSLFWEEVEREAQRLERGESAAASAGVSRSPGDPQERIDALRAQVADLAQKLEHPTQRDSQAGLF